MKHLELFAGVGGFRRAFELLGRDESINIKSIGYSEIDKYATQTYNANFDTEGELVLGDIVKFTSDIKNIKKLDDFHILTGGFPCQSFSMMGKEKGFNDIRGNVFFNILDILKIKQPPFVLLENVRNLLNHDKKNTIKVIEQELKNVGYPNIFYSVFNSENFGLAQKRNRVFIFATNIKLLEDLDFNEHSVVKEKYYLSSILKQTIISNGSKSFKSKSEINQLIARPLTATMVKMHRACQDNYYSYEFLNSTNPIEYLKTKYSKEEQVKHKIRKLTPHEAFLLQGFTENFVDNAINVGVSNHQLYKQAGNAVSVNTVYAILHYLFLNKELIKYVF